MLAFASGPAGTGVEYTIGGQVLTGAEREAAAQLLADDAMRIRCGTSSILDRWRARRDGHEPGDPAQADVVATYACLGFGLRNKDPANADHLQGLVAELLWNRLIGERTSCSGERRLVKAHPVKPDPLEPGGDGLVIYMVGSTLVFRLWEIKKHDSAKKPVSATIRRASKQLASRGNEYLAKLAGPETIEQGGPLGDFYADIVELWLDGSDRAGVGVSVGTSAAHAPSQPSAFRSIVTAFPHFNREGQAESVIVAMPDFPGFATRVRDIVWSGL
jgi:hypothetical protein